MPAARYHSPAPVTAPRQTRNAQACPHIKATFDMFRVRSPGVGSGSVAGLGSAAGV